MWKDLTMGQKSEVMRLAVQQGFSDLNNIREMYDTATSVYNTSPHNTYDNVPYSPSPKDVRYSDGGMLSEVIVTPNRDYNVFLNSLPPNQRYGGNDFNTYRYWELHGKPVDFEAALKTNPPMYTLEDDGYYHAGSIAYNRDNDTYEFMKSPNHPTVDLELLQYWNNPDLEEFRSNYGLDLDSNSYKYIRRGTTDKPLYAYGGPLGNIYQGKGNKSQKLSKAERQNRVMWSLGQPFYKEMRLWNTGLSDVALAGILGNIALESGFNPEATNTTHHGYLQNQNTIRDYIVKYYGGYGHKEQMQYLHDGLIGKLKGGNTSMGKQMQKRFNNYISAVKDVADPVKASQLWEKYYEISGGQAMGARQQYAKHFYDQISATAPGAFRRAKMDGTSSPLKRENYRIAQAPQIDYNSPIYYHPVQDMAWTPPTGIMQQTQDDIAPFLVQQNKPIVVNAFEDTSSTPEDFSEMWANIFPQVEEEPAYIPTPHEQLMTLQSRPRRTAQPTPAVVQPTPMVDNNYLLFEPMSTLGYGGILYEKGGTIKGAARDGSRDINYNPYFKRWTWGSKNALLPLGHRVKMSDGYEYQLNSDGTKTKIGKKPSKTSQAITELLHDTPNNNIVEATLDLLDGTGGYYNGLTPYLQTTIMKNAPLYAARTGDMSSLVNDNVGISTNTIRNNPELPRKLMPFYSIDTLYLPEQYKQQLEILGRGVSINKDNVKGLRYNEEIPFTYDARNHDMQIRRDGDSYYTDFSDVFDTNNKFFDSNLNPIIFSQYNIPTVFTNDTTLLNKNQSLSDEIGKSIGRNLTESWAQDYLNSAIKDVVKNYK